MAKKRLPSFCRILDGMNCCYGGTDERQCGICPYSDYNDAGMFGEGGADCMLTLNKDAKKMAEGLSSFTFCKHCICYRADKDPQTWKDADHGHCSNWDCDVLETEYCAWGGVRE